LILKKQFKKPIFFLRESNLPLKEIKRNKKIDRTLKKIIVNVECRVYGFIRSLRASCISIFPDRLSLLILRHTDKNINIICRINQRSYLPKKCEERKIKDVWSFLSYEMFILK